MQGNQIQSRLIRCEDPRHVAQSLYVKTTRRSSIKALATKVSAYDIKMVREGSLCGLSRRRVHEKQDQSKSFAEALVRPSQANQKRIFG